VLLRNGCCDAVGPLDVVGPAIVDREEIARAYHRLIEALA
jgi:hypothetical protein